MPVAGLVLTLSCDGGARDALFETLRGMQGLTVGPRKGAQVALVLETATLREQRDVWDALSETPGVAGIQLAYAHLDENDHRDIEPGPNDQEVPS